MSKKVFGLLIASQLSLQFTFSSRPTALTGDLLTWLSSLVGGRGIKIELGRCHLISNSSEAFNQLFFGCTCGSGCLTVALDTVDLVGLSDVQLVAFWDLLEVGAFVESAPEPGLPHGGVGFVPPLPVLAFINSPGLNGV